MKTGLIAQLSAALGAIVIGLGVGFASTVSHAAPSQRGADDLVINEDPFGAFDVAHCCHPHNLYPYDNYCCHGGGSTVYVAPAYGYAYGAGAVGVRGVARRTSRRTVRRRR